MKSKSKTKPIYEKEITGAADTLTNVYNSSAAGIKEGSDAIGGLLPGMVEKYNAGDVNLNAARGYDADVLSGKYLGQGNPYLADQIARTNNSVRNQAQASFGSRGLTNGSDYYLGLADRLAANETNLRYQDYGSERGRMDAASGRAPGLIAADNARLDPLLASLQARLMPLQAASGYAGGIGGLLGQYSKTSQKGALLPMLIGAAQNGAQAAAGAGG